MLLYYMDLNVKTGYVDRIPLVNDSCSTQLASIMHTAANLHMYTRMPEANIAVGHILLQSCINLLRTR